MDNNNTLQEMDEEEDVNNNNKSTESDKCLKESESKLSETNQKDVVIDVNPTIECESSAQPSSKFTIFGYSPSQIKWSNVIWLFVIHCLAIWAYIHVMFSPIKVLTYIFAAVISIASGFGMSVGGHRLWSHRTFKARFPLRLLLAVLQTMTINGSIFSYSRDHRNHHKWPATHADPKNPGRGFFFAHMGWWLLKKRPEVIEYGRKVPVDDLLSDWLVYYQHKFYLPLVILTLVIPPLIPYYVWDESALTSFLICTCLRVVVVLHHLFTVNSVAHFYGDKPYDKFMKPTENRVINWISMGEGKHNYHHTFPYDYSNSEKKWWEIFNPATLFIDICCLIGLAYDCKKPSPETIEKVIQRKGLPEYFAAEKQRNLCKKIIIGAIDWFFGALFCKWPIWPIIIVKLLTGQQLIN